MWRYNFDYAFHGAEAQTKPQDVSRFLMFVNKIMSNDTQANCF